MKANDETETCGWIKSAVARYEGRLLRYAAQITGDVERARDVVQDTFLRLCSQDRAQVDGHLAQWLYTVCRNRALDMRRKERRMQSITAEQELGQANGEVDQSVAVERREVAAHVLRLVEGLSENQREVVRLKFQDGLSYREISHITQLSVSNVGYLLHTALRRLRDQLGVEAGAGG